MFAQEKSKLIDDLAQQNQRLTSELVEVSKLTRAPQGDGCASLRAAIGRQ